MIELTGPAEDNFNWPLRCLDEATGSDVVPEGVKDILAAQLAGTAQQRSLKPSELKELAAQLIAALEPPRNGDAA